MPNIVSNIEKYKKDLKRLIDQGSFLSASLYKECFPEKFDDKWKDTVKNEDELQKLKESLPSFRSDYQSWYSEALAVVALLLPGRIEDFTKQYAKPKTQRKEISHENYVIEDYLQVLEVTRTSGGRTEKIVWGTSAIPRFQQQLNILRAAQGRFESSLFDIKQLLQADLFDSELEAAKELNKKGFTRGAGAIAGVVLEAHLAQVCGNHKITVRKKNPAIGDLNNFLKEKEVIEVPTWRFIQHLGDIRNKCDHKQKSEPTKEEIAELIAGVEKITKSVF